MERFFAKIAENHAFLTTDSSLLPARLIGLSLGFITYRGAAVSDEAARRKDRSAGRSDGAAPAENAWDKKIIAVR